VADLLEDFDAFATATWQGRRGCVVCALPEDFRAALDQLEARMIPRSRMAVWLKEKGYSIRVHQVRDHFVLCRENRIRSGAREV
jgi:hypothetical protein